MNEDDATTRLVAMVFFMHLFPNRLDILQDMRQLESFIRLCIKHEYLSHFLRVLLS